MAKKFKKVLCLIMAAVLNISVISYAGAEQAAEDKGEAASFSQSEYDRYYSKAAEFPFINENILLEASSAENFEKEIIIANAADSGGNDVSKPAVLLNEIGTNKLKWNITAEKDMRFQVILTYLPQSKGENLKVSLLIDGAAPFNDSKAISLRKAYKNQYGIKADKYGNDQRPPMHEVEQWQELRLQEFEYFNPEPFSFYVAKGNHTITLSAVEGEVAVASVLLCGEQKIEDHKDYLKANGFEGLVNAGVIKKQAEDTFMVSSPSIYAVADRSNSAIEPQSPDKVRLNVLGNGNWRFDGQQVTWKIKVTETGFYNIAFKVKQSILRGMNVTRKLYIDGEVPFTQAGTIEFPYNSKWYIKTLGDKSPQAVYLTAGEHTVTLEALAGDTSPTLKTLSNSLYELNKLYREIIMITGTNPDPMQDYKLDLQVNDLIGRLEKVRQAIHAEGNRLENVFGSSVSEVSVLNETAYLLDKFIYDPDEIVNSLNVFRDNISALGTTQLKLQEQPLDMDYLCLYGSEAKLPSAKPGIWDSILFEFRKFVATFYNDYNAVGESGEDAVEVWMSSGRDQTQILRRIIDDEFTPKTGIKVGLNIVSTGDVLIQATLVNKGPDVALMVPKEYPINLAMRNALIPVSDFKDFNSVKERFLDCSMIPFDYKNNYYALPETLDFSMMFYRKDVFDELGLPPPNTWEEFYDVVSFLQRRHMTSGIPDNQGTFDMFLYQRNASFYKPDLKSTNLDSDEALESFEEWTNLYRKLGMPRSFDFFNRFRTGEMPIGIVSYNFYNLLTAAAPELAGQWDMLPIPGRIDKSGDLNRSEGSNGSASIILKRNNNPEDSWEFVKWWTSEETQARYGNELEQLMGTASRYNTANINAMSQLPWSKKQLEKLKEQMESLTDMPQVPGNYIVTRNLTNAFRNVCDTGKNPREMLTKYNSDINKELTRKQSEFE
mgnify:CR=1 FL=1